jgi:lauroyl/myristoyl acyltransferase
MSFRLPRYDAGFWRAFARWGATRMPRWFLRSSPGPIGLGIGLSQAAVRAQIVSNLRLLHGERTPLEEGFDVAATLASFGHCLAEGLAAAGDDPPDFRYTVESREHLIHARDAHKGAVLVTAHVGSWDVAGSVMNLRGFDLAIAMAPERDPAARAISDASRARTGVKVIHVGDDPLAALPLARHVRAGGAVALQIDRVPPGMRAYPAQLFGRPWAVPFGPFQLAQVTGAPIIPVFTARLGFVHHLVHADPPIHVPKRATKLEMDNAIAAATNSIETFIRRFPTQWFHFAPHPTVEAGALEEPECRAS